MKAFQYHQPTQILFGTGRLPECGQIAANFGKRVLLVSEPLSGQLAVAADRLLASFKKSGLLVSHFEGVKPNPTTDLVTEGARMADVVVGFGGGSAMDTAKAIAVEATHEGSAWDYLFYKKEPTEKTLPVVAITTTSGTGSQVTQVSVITNTAERDKSALYHPLLFPKACVVDPELMKSLPPGITAATGFDAFTHAFEASIHPNASPYVRLLAKEALQLIIKNLPLAINNSQDMEARQAMAWADTLAGLCIANAGVTLPHGMGMAISGLYPHVAHGQALAAVYPAFARFTWEHAIKDFAWLARRLDPSLEKEKDSAAAEACSETITVFLQKIGLSIKLSKLNVNETELDLLAKQCLVLPDYQSNPRVATDGEMMDLVKASF